MKKKPAKAVIIEALLNAANGYLTQRPENDASNATNTRPTRSSKTAGARITSHQKSEQIKKAIDEGTVKTSALAEQLKAQNVQRAIPPVVSLVSTDWYSLH